MYIVNIQHTRYAFEYAYVWDLNNSKNTITGYQLKGSYFDAIYL